MLVDDGEEIQICRRAGRKRRIEFIPTTSEDLFPEVDRLDFYRVLSDCKVFQTPAWYTPTIRQRLRPIKFVITSPGRTLHEELTEYYQTHADEDLEMCRKFKKFEVGFVDVPDSER